MFQIGPYRIDSLVVLAPMAGVTDLPFRQLCRRHGAGLVVSEMVTSDTRLWNTRKSRNRLNNTDEIEPRSVQIAGSDPLMMAEAAAMSVENGAQIIDINMGCPAKKVCKKAAGSALMKDEKLVAEILRSVVNAVDVPVTLKTRTGWAIDQKNAVAIAKIAEDSGIQALAIHGRTRACAFRGDVEYDTIAEVKSRIGIPIIANGDINSPEKALEVLKYTNADAVMIGRAAQGKPWICREIDQYLRNGVMIAPPEREQIKHILLGHLHALYEFYDEFLGVKIARKHVGWYLQQQGSENTANAIMAPATEQPVKIFRQFFNKLEQASQQIQAINDYFDESLDEKLIENNVAAGSARNNDSYGNESQTEIETRADIQDNSIPTTSKYIDSVDTHDATMKNHQEVIAA
ncbi:MAG: tRNA-dihydrouridine synthase B [Oceanicoccus sp.]